MLKIGHNLKYDMIVLGPAAGSTSRRIDDTIVMSFDLDAGLHGHGMDELAATHLSHSCIAFKDVVGTGKTQRSFDEVDLKAATRYAAEDADVTLRLWRRFKPRLPAEAATRVYEMVDRPLVPVIAQMERHGIKVDRREAGQALDRVRAPDGARWRTKSTRSPAARSRSAAPSNWATCCSSGWGSRAGARASRASIRPTSTSSSGSPRTRIRRARISRARCSTGASCRSSRSTYTDALQAQINPATGRVHTSYSLTGAQTGRLSSTDPNLQNIPIRTEIGRQIRDAFVAEPGNVLLAADYSQIELRLAAHMADVPALKQAFANGDDIHSLTAQELFGEVNRDTRGRAKTINFAILYGISRWGLAGRLDVTADEAQAMIDRYFERFPGIRNYIAHDHAERARDGLHHHAVRAEDALPADQVARSSTSARAPSAPRSTRRSRAPAPTSSSARWCGWGRRWPRPGWGMCGCCCRCTTNWCSSCPRAMSRRRSR